MKPTENLSETHNPSSPVKLNNKNKTLKRKSYCVNPDIQRNSNKCNERLPALKAIFKWKTKVAERDESFETFRRLLDGNYHVFNDDLYSGIEEFNPPEVLFDKNEDKLTLKKTSYEISSLVSSNCSPCTEINN